MINFKKIVIGWTKLATHDKAAAELARKRAEFCGVCEFAVKKKYLDEINDEVEIINGYVCSKCSCPLSAKLRVADESCPLGLW